MSTFESLRPKEGKGEEEWKEGEEEKEEGRKEEEEENQEEEKEGEEEEEVGRRNTPFETNRHSRHSRRRSFDTRQW